MGPTRDSLRNEIYRVHKHYERHKKRLLDDPDILPGNKTCS